MAFGLRHGGTFAVKRVMAHCAILSVKETSFWWERLPAAIFSRPAETGLPKSNFI
jgi:hypothetical protein